MRQRTLRHRTLGRLPACRRLGLGLQVREAALQILLQQSFSVPKHGSFGIATLTDLLQDLDCYRLTVSSLDTAVGLLKGLSSA